MPPDQPKTALKLNLGGSRKLRDAATELGIDTVTLADAALGQFLSGSVEDIRKRFSDDQEKRDRVLDSAEEISLRTSEWAGLAGPFAWAMFTLFGIVLVLPFLVIAWVPELPPEVRVAQLSNWGTHVLAVVVGLVGSVVAYYFGQRQGAVQGPGSGAT